MNKKDINLQKNTLESKPSKNKKNKSQIKKLNIMKDAQENQNVEAVEAAVTAPANAEAAINEKIFEVKESDENGTERSVGYASESFVNYVHGVRNTANQFNELYNLTKEENDTLKELIMNIKNYIEKSNLLSVKWYEVKKLLTAVKTIVKMIDEFFKNRKELKEENRK